MSAENDALQHMLADILEEQAKLLRQQINRLRGIAEPADNSPEGKKKKRKQNNGEPKPKRPLTGYQMFMSEKLKAHKEENPSSNAKDIMTLVNKEWTALDDNTKVEYKVRAEKLKEHNELEHDAEHEATTSTSSSSSNQPTQPVTSGEPAKKKKKKEAEPKEAAKPVVTTSSNNIHPPTLAASIATPSKAPVPTYDQYTQNQVANEPTAPDTDKKKKKKKEKDEKKKKHGKDESADE